MQSNNPGAFPAFSASISAGLDRESLFPGGAAGGRCGTGFPAARRRFHRAYGNAGFEVQAIRIAQQLFDAHLRDSPLQQVAHRRLVLIQQVHQLRLRVTFRPDVLKDGGQYLRLDLQGTRLRRGEAQRIENISFDDVGRLISRYAFLSRCHHVDGSASL